MSTARKVVLGILIFFLSIILLGGIYGALNTGGNSSTSTGSSLSSTNEYGISYVGFSTFSDVGMEGGNVVSGCVMYVYDGQALVANVTIENLTPWNGTTSGNPGYNLTTVVRVDASPTQTFSLNNVNMTFEGQSSPIKVAMWNSNLAYSGQYQTSDGKGQGFMFDWANEYGNYAYRFLVNNQAERTGITFTLDLVMQKSGNSFAAQRSVSLGLDT
jgi:hypothetical protein